MSVRLLFDENLSHRVAAGVAEAFPKSTHVRDHGLLGAPDDRIWAYAREQGYLLVSKDADFFQRSMLYGAPPKVLWLRIGNAPTREVVALLTERRAQIEGFAEDPATSLLSLRHEPRA